MRRVLLALLLISAPALAGAEIEYVGAGTASNTAAYSLTVTPTAPANIKADDLLLIVAHSWLNATISVTTGTGWAQAATQFCDTAGCLSVWWKRATGTSEATPTLSQTGTAAKFTAQMHAFRGVRPAPDSPFSAMGSVVNEAAATTFTGDTLTPSVANSMVVFVAGSRDDNTWGTPGGSVGMVAYVVNAASTNDNSLVVAWDETAHGTSTSAQAAPTIVQTSLGGDSGKSLTFALAPAAAPTTYAYIEAFNHAQVSADASNTVTAAITTTDATLLVAYLHAYPTIANESRCTDAATSVSGGGLTWTQQSRMAANNNTCTEIWTAPLSGALSNVTVTGTVGTGASNNARALALYALGNADTTLGSVVTQNCSGVAFQNSVTTSANSEVLFGFINGYSTGATWLDTTLRHDQLSFTGGGSAGWGHAADVTTATTTTYGTSAPTGALSGSCNAVSTEVLFATGGPPPIELAGSAALGVTTGAAELSVPKPLTGSAALGFSGTGALTTSIPLAGAASIGASAGTATLVIPKPLVGSATLGVTGGAAAATTSVRLAGSAAAGVTAGSAAATTEIRLGGSSALGFTTSGELQAGSSVALAGSAAIGASAGAAALSTAVQLVGAAAIGASSSGALTTAIRMAGSALAGVSTSTATLSLPKPLAGAASLGASTSSPALTTAIRLAGSALAGVTGGAAALSVPKPLAGAALLGASTGAGALSTAVRLGGAAALGFWAGGELTGGATPEGSEPHRMRPPMHDPGMREPGWRGARPGRWPR